MKKKISDKDKKDWEKFINSSKKLENKDKNTTNEFFSYNEKSIDLHGYTLDQANTAVEQFITQAFSEEINKLIIVTGKGIHSNNEKNPYVSQDLSILKYSVPEFISSNKKLMKMIYEIKDAKIEDGGSGAFYVYLKKNKKS